MTTVQPCKACGKKFPWMNLYLEVMQALAAKKNTLVTVPMMLAIVIKESQGSHVFAVHNSLCQANLKTMSLLSGVSADSFLTCNLIKQGALKGWMPQFRFEKSWYKESRDLAETFRLSPVQAASVSSSWGLGQKSGLYFLKGRTPSDGWEDLVKFQNNRAWQLQTIVEDFDHLIHHSAGNIGLAYERYNEGPEVEKIGDYAVVCESLEAGFVKQLTKEGLQLCLDLTPGQKKLT